MTRYAIAAALLVSCSDASSDCRDRCPETLTVAQLCRQRGGCTVGGEPVDATTRRLEPAPGERVRVPLSIVRAAGVRDAISLDYPFTAPDDRQVHAIIDGVVVPVVPFSSVSRHDDGGFYRRFVRIPPSASELEVYYEGSPVASLELYAFDLECIASKPPCAL